ncbi:MAG: glutathione S-transferase family protein [Myxococcales bacterium]|nr:glutathione S-transferase family protein [Myxococcales bacterium]
MPTLYTTARSANGRKPLIACRLLALDIEVVDVDVYAGEGQAPWYRAVNPWGKIPTLVDGALTLWESNAILLHLTETRGDGRLLPRASAERALVYRWLFWEASQWQPACAAALAPAVGALLRGDDPPPPAWDAPPLRAQLEHLDASLASGHLVGDALTIADIAVAGMAMYLGPCGLPRGHFPRVDAWYARLAALPAWRETAAPPWR